MAAIKFQNIRFHDRRGSMEGQKVYNYLSNNNIKFTYNGRAALPSDLDANSALATIKSFYSNNSLTFPICIYETVYYESGNHKVANNEYSLTVSGFPSNFANVAVKTS
jgi:hypothetical protein